MSGALKDHVCLDVGPCNGYRCSSNSLFTVYLVNKSKGCVFRTCWINGQ